MEITEQNGICIENNKNDKVENITCSYGLVALRKDEDSEALLYRVDKLLYDAKDCSKNVVVCETGRIEKR